jgi:hypothetical protein
MQAVIGNVMGKKLDGFGEKTSAAYRAVDYQYHVPCL